MFQPITSDHVQEYKIKEKPKCIQVQYTYLRKADVIPTLHCWTPPVGWVFNPDEDKWIHTGVYKRSHKKEECYWEVDPRFKEYKKWKKEEEKIQKANPEYRHPALYEFIRWCWQCRLGGFWFSNNGVDTYVTGQHWFYLSVFRLDTGLPKYREVDSDVFYIWDYVSHDPSAYGLILLTKRRNGKTYTGGSLSVEQTSRQQKFRTGIQSKTDDDAFKVYEEHIIFPFKTIPYFFKPDKINLPKNGRAPTSGLKFNSGNLDDDFDEDNEELQSVIDYRPSRVSAYDGWKMKFYYADEIGKTILCSVYDRWTTVKKCLVDDDDNVIGKSFQTTTVEDIEAGGREFFKLYKDSDQGKKENGQTISGLFKIFVPAFKTRNIDKYGKCDEEANRQYYLQKRERQRNNPKELAKEIRQNPFTEEEAFTANTALCVFDPIKIQGQVDNLTWLPSVPYRTGNFHWKDGIFGSDVVFIENPNGRFMVVWEPPEEMRNRQIERGSLKYPGATELCAAGVDTYDHRGVKDGNEQKLSFGSITVVKKEGPMYPTEFDGGPVCGYLYRSYDPKVFYQDVLMCLIYYGCLGLIETNKPGLQNWMEEKGYEGYSAMLPGANKRGINNSGTTTINNYIGELIEQFIAEKISTVMFLELLNQFFEFSPADTTAFDFCMSFGYALMLIKSSISRLARTVPQKDVKDYLSWYN